MHKTGLIAALDVNDLQAERDLLEKLKGTVKYYKVGSVLFTAAGPAAVELVHKYGGEVFLDLKFHDIPNTVRGAVRGAAAMGVYSVSLHLSGGADMLKACAALEKRPKLWGITVLTSFDENTLFRSGFRGGIEKTVKLLAKLGLENGADGVVCSPLEAGLLRKAYGGGFTLVTPGIRPAAQSDDQKRTVAPGAARSAGADFLFGGGAPYNARGPPPPRPPE